MAVALAAVLGSGLVTAGAFVLADAVVGGMPGPGWGMLAGCLLAVASWLRTGREHGPGRR